MGSLLLDLPWFSERAGSIDVAVQREEWQHQNAISVEPLGSVDGYYHFYGRGQTPDRQSRGTVARIAAFTDRLMATGRAPCGKCGELCPARSVFCPECGNKHRTDWISPTPQDDPPHELAKDILIGRFPARLDVKPKFSELFFRQARFTLGVMWFFEKQLFWKSESKLGYYENNRFPDILMPFADIRHINALTASDGIGIGVLMADGAKYSFSFYGRDAALTGYAARIQAHWRESGKE